MSGGWIVGGMGCLFVVEVVLGEMADVAYYLLEKVFIFEEPIYIIAVAPASHLVEALFYEVAELRSRLAALHL